MRNAKIFLNYLTFLNYKKLNILGAYIFRNMYYTPNKFLIYSWESQKIFSEIFNGK